MDYTEGVVEQLAFNVAWMFSYKPIPPEEVRAAVRDLLAKVDVDEDLVKKVYARYLMHVETKPSAN